MRAVVQRVSRAEVRIGGEVVGTIGRGLCVLVGAGKGDVSADAESIAEKLVNLRIFEDEAGKMNLSLLDTGGGLLIVSQFTLFGDARKGRRPSFVDALEPEAAERLCAEVVSACARLGIVDVQTGRFRTMMEVELVNWGPVTILLDSKKTF